MYLEHASCQYACLSTDWEKFSNGLTPLLRLKACLLSYMRVLSQTISIILSTSTWIHRRLEACDCMRMPCVIMPCCGRQCGQSLSIGTALGLIGKQRDIHSLGHTHYHN